MDFITKEDYINAVNIIMEPVRRALRQGGARPVYGSASAWYDDISVYCESFARPLWALVPLWHGGYGDEELKTLYREGLISGTDPGSMQYWGETGENDQRYVEMASIAYGLLFAPDVLWEPMNEKQRTDLASWLRQINAHSVCDSNWRFFRVLVNIALKAVGEAYSEERLSEDLTRLDEFYVGGGWYKDGMQNQKDYYIPMAFHFYGLIYSCFEKDNHAKRFRERAEKFAREYIYWFSRSGAALPYGRSLTYRFAQGAFWSACLMAGIKPFETAVIKGLISRHLNDWASAHILDNGGVLTVGYRYQDLIMAEHYNAPGSPYWGLKFFAMLALDDDEFWTAPAADMPKLHGRRLMREADMLVCREAGEVFAYPAGTHNELGCGHIPEKYLKFVYSTAFGFNVRYSSDSLPEAAPDSMLAFDVGGVYVVRRKNYSFEISENGLVVDWSPMDGIEVRTEIELSGASHIRRHEVRSEFDCVAYDCGYALAAADKDHCRAGADRTLAWVENNTARCEVSSVSGEGLSFGAAVNTNILSPKTVIPAIKYNIHKGRTVIETEIKVDFIVE
ncbi:MAG: DUF2264 domain-containing protein [Clostridia bacterium]|nr:DUF2264 domain-containing protein [Clostridia bacterium]